MALSDIITASTEPVNKLIDAVAGAIGKIYEPRCNRKRAEAKAYEIKIISEAVRNNSDIPIIYSGTDISIDTSDYGALAERASKRLAYQEITKQENIENVLDSAYEELSGKCTRSSENVSRDWMTRFINSVEDISDEEMQKICGKILAGEIIEPHSFSYKTLDCMRNLSNSDARLFEKVCPFVIEGNYIIHDAEIMNKVAVTYKDLLILDECGLINSSGMITASQRIEKEKLCITDFGEYILIGEIGKETGKADIHIQQFPLTKAGREIYSIIKVNNSLEYIKRVSESIRDQNSMVNISLHKVLEREETGIRYDEIDLLSAEET